MQIVNRLESFFYHKTPILDVTIADIETKEDQENLAKKIHGFLKGKIYKNIVHGSVVLAISTALLAAIFKVFVEVIKKYPNAHKELEPIFCFTAAPVGLVMWIGIGNIFKGLKLLYQKKYSLNYSTKVVEKVGEFFKKPTGLNRNCYLASVNFSSYDLKKELMFTNGLEGCISDSKLYILDNRKEDCPLRKGIVKSIKDHGLASFNDHLDFGAISRKDEDWKHLVPADEIEEINKIRNNRWQN